MTYLADARTKARDLLQEHGSGALLRLSDAMATAVRDGDLAAAERWEKILVQAEYELDGKPIAPVRLMFWRRDTVTG